MSISGMDILSGFAGLVQECGDAACARLVVGPVFWEPADFQVFLKYGFGIGGLVVIPAVKVFRQEAMHVDIDGAIFALANEPPVLAGRDSKVRFSFRPRIYLCYGLEVPVPAEITVSSCHRLFPTDIKDACPRRIVSHLFLTDRK